MEIKLSIDRKTKKCLLNNSSVSQRYKNLERYDSIANCKKKKHLTN